MTVYSCPGCSAMLWMERVRHGHGWKYFCRCIQDCGFKTKPVYDDEARKPFKSDTRYRPNCAARNTHA